MTRELRLAVLLLAASSAPTLRAATYLPMSDADLAVQAPVIVRATPVSREVRLERVGGEDLPFTVVTLQRAEALRGSIGETFSVILPGGRAGGSAWFLPGVPRLSIAGDVVLMLRPAGRAGEWHLTELGLSAFDIGQDEAGRRFAVRLEFGAIEDLAVSKRADVADAYRAKSAPARVPARDADSFLAALRAVGRGEPMPDVVIAEPTGEIGRPHGARPKWVNIGGREPGDCDGVPCLFRWFWETGAPSASVHVVGTQTNLTDDDAAGCGTDALCDVQNGVDGWHGVAAADVHVTGPASTGTVTVNLDATSSQDNGATWSSPIGCTGGVIGLGGPGSGTNPRTYRGDANFFGPSSGTVSMRKSTCTSGYSARTFKTAVMHELGHVLGLGHPNQEQSIHTTTTPSDWNTAVMTSSIPTSKPEAPQADDIQGIQFLYGTAAAGAAPGAGFTFSPASPAAGSPVSFTDTSTNSPTGWQWDFGDASGSHDRNPTHTFSTPGTYPVTLLSGSVNGTGSTSRSVVVKPAGGSASCAPSPMTLCLNSGRFAVTASFRTSNGQTGNATGVGLTADSGYFWFFNPANIEVVVKVLNACTLNPPRYWVFAAGLTNVEVTLRVTDTQAGGSPQTYTNPLNTPFAPIQDTDAFATCP